MRNKQERVSLPAGIEAIGHMLRHFTIPKGKGGNFAVFLSGDYTALVVDNTAAANSSLPTTPSDFSGRSLCRKKALADLKGVLPDWLARGEFLEVSLVNYNGHLAVFMRRRKDDLGLTRFKKRSEVPIGAHAGGDELEHDD